MAQHTMTHQRTVEPIIDLLDDEPRDIGTKTLDDRLALSGSLIGALALDWVCYEVLLGWSGTLGFVVMWFVLFLGLYAAVTAVAHPIPIVRDRVAAAVITGGAAIVGLALLTTLVYTFARGFPAFRHINFYTQDMAGIGPNDPLTKGGILHAITGSAIEVGIAVLIGLPLGIGTAVFMTEVRGKGARLVRTVVEAMTALPDIIAGLFVYTTLIVGLGTSRTGFAASMALTIMLIPIVARAADVALRVVPGGLREASQALGASQWQTVRRVVLPTARSGLATALILGIARIVGETAPVLITSGASTFLNVNPVVNPMNSLPLFALSSVRGSQPNYITRGFGAASVLLALVLILFVTTRFLARQRVGKR